MASYRIENATLSTEWKFNHILSELPTPGTKGFANLVQGLQPFGLTDRGISLQTPTNNLSDVRLDLALPDHRATVSIGYSYIILNAGEVFDGEAATLLRIIQAVFSAMVEVDPKTEQGKGTTRVSLQLPLLDEQADAFMARFAKKQEGPPTIIPDAAAFIVKHDETSQEARTRIIFARSIHYDNALFCEVSWEYESDIIGKPIDFLGRLVAEELNILTLFDLHNAEEK